MSDYAVRRHAAPAAFWARAEPFLLEREAEHTLMIGLTLDMIERAAAPPDTLFATVEADDAVVGCVLRTPPEKLVLTRLPLGALPAVADFVAGVYDALPAVIASEPEASAFAVLWSNRHGLGFECSMEQGIYELTEVIELAARAPGFLRSAAAGDVALVAEWLAGFAAEAAHPLADAERVARERIARGSLWLWVDGEPVCLAGRMGRTPHGDRIGFVYTPRERRGRGYASACVAALSRRVLDEGLRFCALYTDMSNPTSNDIYRKLGYRLVAGSVVQSFAPRS